MSGTRNPRYPAGDRPEPWQLECGAPEPSAAALREACLGPVRPFTVGVDPADRLRARAEGLREQVERMRGLHPFAGVPGREVRRSELAVPDASDPGGGREG